MLTRWIRRHLRTAWRDRRGVAALEFAFGAPAMIALMVAGFDTSRYVMATRHIEAAAATIGQMVAVSATGQISPADLQFYEDSTMVIFPLVLQDSSQQSIAWTSDIAITVSSIWFVAAGPLYVGTTKWSVGSNLRPCALPMISVSDTVLSSPTSLPADVFGPGTLIVVDVNYTFRPTIAVSFLPKLTIKRSFYVQPRYVTFISYTGTSSSTVNQC